MTNGGGYVQLSCSFNGNYYAYSDWFGTDFNAAINGLYLCLTAVDETGDPYFSRKSTHHESRDQITISPYTGENTISASSLNNTKTKIQYNINNKISQPDNNYIDQLDLYESFLFERKVNNRPLNN
jgi:hypothetical protein